MDFSNYNITMDSLNWEQLRDYAQETFGEYQAYILSNLITLAICLIISKLFSSKEDYLLKSVKKEFKNIEKVKMKLVRSIQSLQSVQTIIFYVKIILIATIVTLAGILIFNSYFRGEKNISLVMENKYNVYLIAVLLCLLMIMVATSALLKVILKRRRHQFESLDGNQVELAHSFLKGIGPELTKLLKEQLASDYKRKSLELEFFRAKIARLDVEHQIGLKERELLTKILKEIEEFRWCENCYKMGTGELKQEIAALGNPQDNKENNKPLAPEPLQPQNSPTSNVQTVDDTSKPVITCQLNCLQAYFRLSKQIGELYKHEAQQLCSGQEVLKQKKKEEEVLAAQYQECLLVASTVPSKAAISQAKGDSKKKDH